MRQKLLLGLIGLEALLTGLKALPLRAWHVEPKGSSAMSVVRWTLWLLAHVSEKFTQQAVAPSCILFEILQGLLLSFSRWFLLCLM
jgi:hypothetical protein